MVPPERGGDTIQRAQGDKGIFQNVAFRGYCVACLTTDMGRGYV